MDNPHMDEGRDSTMATALQMAVILGCFAAVGVLLTTTGGPFAGPLRTGPILDLGVFDGGRGAAVLLICAGAGIVAARGPRNVGLLAFLLGAAWLGVSATGSPTLPPFVPAVAAGASPLVAVLLLVLALVVREDASPHRWRSWVVAALVTTGIALAVLRVTSYDPFSDPACTIGCAPVNPIVALSPVARLAVSRAIDVLSLGAGFAAVLVGTRALRSRQSRTPARIFIYVGCVLAGGGRMGASVLVLVGPSALSSVGVGGWAVPVASFVEAAGAVILGAGLAWSLVDFVVLRVRMGRLSGEIASLVGGVALERALATALGEQSVAIGYRLPDGAAYIAPGGEPFSAQEPGPGQTVTTVALAGEAIAVIRHGTSLDSTAVRAQITPRMQVALDNERLRAISLATLRTLRESRARIVAIEDEERRRIERDLHDGAQQRILAIAFELRHSRSEAERAGDRVAVNRLDWAEKLAFAALDELRRVARGVHPAILSQGGLAPALSSLAEDTSVAMTLEIDRSLRLPSLIEATAYQVVAEAVSDAARSGATEVAVAVASSDVSVTLDVEFDGLEPAAWPVRIEDRVSAIGGDISVDRPTQGRTRIHAVLPCG
jgi:signal transduction histidine kinase